MPLSTLVIHENSNINKIPTFIDDSEELRTSVEELLFMDEQKKKKCGFLRWNLFLVKILLRWLK